MCIRSPAFRGLSPLPPCGFASKTETTGLQLLVDVVQLWQFGDAVLPLEPVGVINPCAGPDCPWKSNIWEFGPPRAFSPGYRVSPPAGVIAVSADCHCTFRVHIVFPRQRGHPLYLALPWSGLGSAGRPGVVYHRWSCSESSRGAIPHFAPF